MCLSPFLNKCVLELLILFFVVLTGKAPRRSRDSQRRPIGGSSVGLPLTRSPTPCRLVDFRCSLRLSSSPLPSPPLTADEQSDGQSGSRSRRSHRHGRSAARAGRLSRSVSGSVGGHATRAAHTSSSADAHSHSCGTGAIRWIRARPMGACAVLPVRRPSSAVVQQRRRSRAAAGRAAAGGGSRGTGRQTRTTHAHAHECNQSQPTERSTVEHGRSCAWSVRRQQQQQWQQQRRQWWWWQWRCPSALGRRRPLVDLLSSGARDQRGAHQSAPLVPR